MLATRFGEAVVLGLAVIESHRKHACIYRIAHDGSAIRRGETIERRGVTGFLGDTRRADPVKTLQRRLYPNAQYTCIYAQKTTVVRYSKNHCSTTTVYVRVIIVLLVCWCDCLGRLYLQTRAPSDNNTITPPYRLRTDLLCNVASAALGVFVCI